MSDYSNKVSINPDKEVFDQFVIGLPFVHGDVEEFHYFSGCDITEEDVRYLKEYIPNGIKEDNIYQITAWMIFQYHLNKGNLENEELGKIFSKELGDLYALVDDLNEKTYGEGIKAIRISVDGKNYNFKSDSIRFLFCTFLQEAITEEHREEFNSMKDLKPITSVRIDGEIFKKVDDYLKAFIDSMTDRHELIGRMAERAKKQKYFSGYEKHLNRDELADCVRHRINRLPDKLGLNTTLDYWHFTKVVNGFLEKINPSES